MIRVIVVSAYAGMAANVGGPVQTEYKTFDIEAPDLEAFVTAQMGSCDQRSIVGIEVLNQEQDNG